MRNREQTERSDGISTVSLICGIFGIVVPIILPIVSIIVGIMAIAKNEKRQTLAGVGMGISILNLCITISIIYVIVALLNSASEGIEVYSEFIKFMIESSGAE